MFRPSVVWIRLQVKNLEPGTALAWRLNGRWRIWDLGTDHACTAVWPDDLIAYCR